MPDADKVFGIRNIPVLSYVTRQAVDDAFERAIRSDHHTVVYGSSKQGKTALRQRHVSDEDCIVIRCSPRQTIENLYMAILRLAQIRVETFEVQSTDVEGKLSVKTAIKAKIPWFGGGDLSAKGEGAASSQNSLHSEFISFDFGDAQSVAELLTSISFKKYVVVENFHYLTDEVQKQLAFDLKTFHETGIRFIVLGIWREANLLLTYNGDLEDRVIEVPVEPWEVWDFDRVAESGCRILNLSITGDIVECFKENAYGNVGMFQEFLKSLCALAGIKETCKEQITLHDTHLAEQALQQKFEGQRGHLIKSLQGLAAQFRDRLDSDPLCLPYYLVKIVLQTPIEQLEAGLERSRLLELIRGVHHRAQKEDIRGGDLTNLLQRLPTYQKDMQPPLLYYDSNGRRLRIVDTRHFFVLARANRAALLEEIPHPLDHRSVNE